MRISLSCFILLLFISMPLAARHHHNGHIKDPVPASFDQDVVIIDVRTDGEFDNEHVVNALHIFYRDIDDEIGEVTADKDRQILVYCAVGMRASHAQDTLRELGYTNVINMGGLEDMIEVGFKTVD